MVFLSQRECAVSSVKFNYNQQPRSQITPLCPVRVTHVSCYTLLMLVKFLAPYCAPSVPFNPLSPNIHIQILHTDIHTFT